MTGIEGGFNLDEHNYEVEETNTIVVMPSWKDIPLTDPELPVEVGTANVSGHMIGRHGQSPKQLLYIDFVL